MNLRTNFLNWRPDQEAFGNDGLTVATNVLHDSEGYVESRLANTGTSLSSTTGELSFLGIDNLGHESGSYVAIGHFSTVNRVNLGTWNVWSEYVATAPAGATGGALHSFSSAELDDKIVACAKFSWATASPTTTTIASGYISYSVQYGSGSSWTALPNSASGIVCGKIGNFVMIGNDNTGIPGNNTVRWCAIGDATDWPTPATDDARSKQAGEEEMDPSNGAVTGIAGDDFYGYIFQESGITKATYIGGDIVFAFDTFEEVRGCAYPDRYVAVDDMVFFESKNGRHVLLDGQIQDIGYGAVDDTYPPTTGFFSLQVNPAITTVFFSNNLAYNYKTQQWTRLPNIDPVLSIDSSTGIIGQWDATGGLTYLRDSTGGTAETATITTGETDINQGGRALIDAVRPLVNGGTVTSRVGVRDALSDSVTWCTGTSVNTRTGKIHYRNATTPPEGRYQRVEFTIADGFTTALGADIDYEPTGRV